MKIGIISDTHDDTMMTCRALEEFQNRGISFVVHAGDISTPDMIALFEGFTLKLALGNCDFDHSGILSACRIFGVEPASRAVEFELDGKKFFVIHSDDYGRYLEAANSGLYDYIITGHTHMYMVKHKHNTLVVNPGAVVRDRHADVEQTCAVLDVAHGEVEKIFLS
jgi:putative phosphoesterase